MISAFFKNEIAKFIDEKAIKADVTINGTTYVVPIRRSIVTDNVIRKQIYLTQNEPAGDVTRVRLLEFQFLIGNIKTEGTQRLVKVNMKFQFLIGNIVNFHFISDCDFQIISEVISA